MLNTLPETVWPVSCPLILSSFFLISFIALPSMLLSCLLRTRASLSTRCIYKPYAPSRPWTCWDWPAHSALLPILFAFPSGNRARRCQKNACTQRGADYARTHTHSYAGWHAFALAGCREKWCFQEGLLVHSSLKRSSASKHSHRSEHFSSVLLQPQPVQSASLAH